jgi:26S proteasome regulatory subunit N9
MDVDIDIPSFLSEAREAAPESLQGSILQMEDLWERRLWHQLTLELEKFFNDPLSAGSRMRMFKDFVGTFEKNINQTKLVALGLASKEECKGTNSLQGGGRLTWVRYGGGVGVYDGAC